MRFDEWWGWLAIADRISRFGNGGRVVFPAKAATSSIIREPCSGSVISSDFDDENASRASASP